MYTLENKLKKPSDILGLYEALNWNDYLKKSTEDLVAIMDGSFYVTYIYQGDQLMATGRIISDGHLTALICGVGVHPTYQNQGYGQVILHDLINFAKSKNLLLELTCIEALEGYYKHLGFEKFTIGMKFKG